MDNANARASVWPALPAAFACSMMPAGYTVGSVNATTHSTAIPSSFAVVNSDCVRAPSLTPSQLMTVSSAIAPAPTTNSRACPQPVTWQK